MDQRVPTDDWRVFDRWAAVLCLVLAAVTLVSSLLVASDVASRGASPAFAVLLAATGVATAFVQWLGWWGLQGPKHWGRAAATWILTLAAVFGVIGAAVDLTQSRLTIPLASIAAIVILTKRPGQNAAGRAATRTGAAVGGALLVATVATYAITWAATSPTSPLVASAEDLDIAITIDCGDESGSMPEQVDVVVRWTWRATDTVVMGPDGVGIGWAGDPDGRPRFMVASTSVSDETMLAAGGAGDAGSVVDSTLALMQSSTWAIEASDGRHGPGEVRLALTPSAAPADRPADGLLLIQYVYAHLDRWTIEDGGRCEW